MAVHQRALPLGQAQVPDPSMVDARGLHMYWNATARWVPEPLAGWSRCALVVRASGTPAAGEPARLAPKASGSRRGWWGLSEHAEGVLDQVITWRKVRAMRLRRWR